MAAIVFSLKRGDINCEIPKFALEREIRSWKKLTLRRGYVTRACNIIIVSRTGERKHPMTVCSAPLPFPFLFLITAETKWTSTPPETIWEQISPPKKAFPFSESQRNYRDEIQFVVEFDSISLELILG